MKKRLAENHSIGFAIREFIEASHLQEGLDRDSVIRIWQTAMGPTIQKYTSRVSFNRQTLYVELNSSVLREELSYGRQKIIAMINEELGKELVKELVLR